MFLNWTMLAGLGAAVIPLVLHLLARAPYQEVEWGAMMFLVDRDARHDTRARLRRWKLGGVRMIIEGLLAAAVARPVYRGSGTSSGGSVSAVLIVDRSFSMGFEETGRSRLDKAKEAALQIIGGLKSGDEVSLIFP